MKHERIFLNDSDERVFVDTYVADLGRRRDAILVIPGGGYSNVCTDREGEPIALSFFAKGYNAFVLGYRVGREGDRFPSQLLDASAAMIYIRSHADELCIDPSRVFAVGFSAGGHLCGSLCTMFAYDEVKAAFGEDYMKVRPTGGILSYPVTTAVGPTHLGSFRRLTGRADDAFSDEEIRKLSLECAVSADTSPMYIWHTAEDQVVPIQGSLKLAMALTEAKVPYMMSVVPYGPHGLALANKITSGSNPAQVQPLAEGWIDRAVEWMTTLPSDSKI